VPAQDTSSSHTPKSRPQAPSSEERLRNQFTWQISLIRLGDSVRNGAKCTWYQQGGREIEGYLAGLDSDCFVVFEPCTKGTPSEPVHTFREHLISRGLNEDIVVHPENTFEDEVAHPQMVARVESFREWVENVVPKAPALPVATPPRNGKPAPRPVPRGPALQPGASSLGPYGPLTTPRFTSKKG
jgi:hypothetical protein